MSPLLVETRKNSPKGVSLPVSQIMQHHPVSKIKPPSEQGSDTALAQSLLVTMYGFLFFCFLAISGSVEWILYNVHSVNLEKRANSSYNSMPFTK